jgi:dUTP pyrophosphatase
MEEKRELLEELKKELMSSRKVYIEKCRDGVIIPEYARIGDAGMDIRACLDKDVYLFPQDSVIIPTGLKMAIPEGYELQVRPRSGLSAKTPIRIANTPGTIDSGYRDEIGIIIQNTSDSYLVPRQIEYYKPSVNVYYGPNNRAYEKHIRACDNYYWENSPIYKIDEKGNKPGIYVIKNGDRIAQIVLSKYETIDFVPTEDVKVLGLNRGGGFGHTGTK